MTRNLPDTVSSKRRPLCRPIVALIGIFALIVSGLMPLAQAVAAASGTGNMLAAICSPNGVRYVEIDLGVAGQERPPASSSGVLDHCPGCLGGGVSALLPVMVTVEPQPGVDHVAPGYSDPLSIAPAEASFRPRAPPVAG